MCCMACTAPDATKTVTLFTANDYPKLKSKESKQSKIWLKIIITIKIKIVTNIKVGISKFLK